MISTSKIQLDRLRSAIRETHRTLKEAKRCIASCRAVIAETDRILGSQRLTAPCSPPVGGVDLDAAKQAVADSEVRIGDRAEEIEQLRAQDLPAEQAEAAQLELKQALWRQRGLVADIRKVLKLTA